MKGLTHLGWAPDAVEPRRWEMADATRRERAGGAGGWCPVCARGRRSWQSRLVPGHRDTGVFSRPGSGVWVSGSVLPTSALQVPLTAHVRDPSPGSCLPRLTGLQLPLGPHGDLSSGSCSCRARLHTAPRRVLNLFWPTGLSGVSGSLRAPRNCIFKCIRQPP